LLAAAGDREISRDQPQGK